METAQKIALTSLDNLFRRYEVDIDHIALKLIGLAKSDPQLLEKRLRSHLLGGVGNEEGKFRGRVDDLLTFYSYLELFYVTGAVELSGSKRELLAKKVLNLPAVRRYYERLYPLALPGALRLRLDGSPVLNAAGVDLSSILISQGYELANEDVGIYLDLLDDYYFDGEGLEDLFKKMTTPEKFARLILHPSNKDDTLSLGARGMIRFLQFSSDFDEFLADIEDETLQSAVWHLYGYWYELCGGETYGALSTLIERLRDWVAPSQGSLGQRVSREEFNATMRSMDQRLLALKRLTSSVYRYHYEKLYLSALDHEHDSDIDLIRVSDASLRGEEGEPA